MTLRPRATEIPELVRSLGSRNASRVNAARTRLSMIGTRAVDALVDALEGDNARVRSHAMPILALIQDPRGRDAIAAMRLDRDARLREIAARCLGRFASPEAVAALERVLTRERVHEVRLAAVRGLVSLYEAGQDLAVRAVLQILLEPAEDPRLRLAASALLPMLRPAERRGIVRRLRQDASPEIVRRAGEIDDLVDDPSPRDRRPLEGLLKRLAHPDYEIWNETVHALAALGSPAIVPLVEEMKRRAHDPEYCARAGLALRAMGPRRGRALAMALDHVDEPLPLRVLVDVTGALGDKVLIYRLKDLIERVRALRPPVPSNGFDPMVRVRAKAHLELARVGSRCAIADLRGMLADPEHRIEIEAVEALEKIGKRDEIPDLLRAFAREDRFTRARIAGAVRAIMRRERIRRNSRIFRSLGPAQRRALEAVLPPPRALRPRRPAKPRAARR